MTYRTVILDRLHARDRRENVFSEIIHANQQLAQNYADLKRRNKRLETELEQNAKGSEGTEAYASESARQRMAELDQRIRELNEERAEMYKTQSENAQRLVTLNERLRLAETSDKENAEKVRELSANVRQLTSKCDLQVQQLKEKDVAIQILQDELAALQLEITTTEERNKKLETENAQLLERWLNKMNEEAEKMNEATQFYESILERARNAEKANNNGQSSSNAVEENRPRAHMAAVVLPTEPPKKLTVHNGEVYCVQASSTGSMFATGGADKKIKIHDSKKGAVKYTLSGALQTITSVAFNATDDLVLGTSADNATRIWHLGTGRLRHTLTGHIGKVFAAKFTNNSNIVVSGSHDRTLKVWDLQRGSCIRTIFTFSSCNDLALVDLDGRTLASGHLDNNLRLWDTRTGNGIKELTGIHRGQITSVSVLSDGTTVLTNSRDNTLKLVDLRMFNIVASYQADSYKNGANWSRACISPDGTYIAAGSADGTLHIWNAQSQKLEKCLKEHSGVICGVSWNTNGSCLYSAETNKVVCIWNTSLTGSTDIL